MNDKPASKFDSNPNKLWSDIFVNELARCGLRDVCIAPGSRSTPLAMSFYANKNIRIHTHLDERSAGYFALGIALASDQPAALLCTSGTAGANFYPAIIEANMSQVPLLVLTADRAHELRHSGANQTIDQVKMFGDHVLWSVDVALPEEDAPQVALRNLRSLAARSLATAGGLRKGAVHLNFPFRKPLEPSQSEGWLDSTAEQEPGSRYDSRPLTTIKRGVLIPTADQVKALAEIISSEPQGLIICGPRCAGGDFPEAVSSLARKCGYPVFADPLSNLRFGPQTVNAPICAAYETFLRLPETIPAPKLVLRFGTVPTSKRLNTFLSRNKTAEHIHILENGVWADDAHLVNHYLQVDAVEFCRALDESLDLATDHTWLDSWMEREEDCWRSLSQHMNDAVFDGAYVAELIHHLPDKSVLFTGNSLPIRHVDQFARPSDKSIRVYANRGASGIDGNISTGLGIASRATPTTILTGDITFYHDSNGLLALRDMETSDVTLVVLNNNGGGIFQRLPIAQFEPPFEALFRVPHGLDLSSIAKTYHLDYYKPTSKEEFRALLTPGSEKRRSRLIEIQTEAKQDHLARLELEALVNHDLSDG